MKSDVKLRGCTNMKLRQLSRLVGRHYEAHGGASGLKNTQYSLLSHIVQQGPLRPTELARAMRLEPSSLTRNLQPLVAQGWVVLAPGGDGRSRLVSATAAGRLKSEDGRRDWKAAQSALNARLGSGRLVALHALLDECIAVIEQPAADGDRDIDCDG